MKVNSTTLILTREPKRGKIIFFFFIYESNANTGITLKEDWNQVLPTEDGGFSDKTACVIDFLCSFIICLFAFPSFSESGKGYIATNILASLIFLTVDSC